MVIHCFQGERQVGGREKEREWKISWVDISVALMGDVKKLRVGVSWEEVFEFFTPPTLVSRLWSFCRKELVFIFVQFLAPRESSGMQQAVGWSLINIYIISSCWGEWAMRTVVEMLVRTPWVQVLALFPTSTSCRWWLKCLDYCHPCGRLDWIASSQVFGAWSRGSEWEISWSVCLCICVCVFVISQKNKNAEKDMILFK